MMFDPHFICTYTDARSRFMNTFDVNFTIFCRKKCTKMHENFPVCQVNCRYCSGCMQNTENLAYFSSVNIKNLEIGASGRPLSPWSQCLYLYLTGADSTPPLYAPRSVRSALIPTQLLTHSAVYESVLRTNCCVNLHKTRTSRLEQT